MKNPKSSAKLIMSVIMLLLLSVMPVQAKHLHPEKVYQKKFCAKIGGTTEFYLLDKSRVDCITNEYAIEVDFAEKWAEATGQSLYYGLMTEKQPGILLILEKQADSKQLTKLEKLSKKYNIKVWTIKPTEL